MPGPYYCQPYGGVACGFGKGGNPAAIKGRCKFDPRCNEMRCASCCFCARHGLREGRNVGRGAAFIAKPKAKAKAQAATGPLAEAAPRALAPVGRLPDLAVNVMAPDAWYTGMLEFVREASEIIIGTYQYDHEALTNSSGASLALATGARSYDLAGPRDVHWENTSWTARSCGSFEAVVC